MNKLGGKTATIFLLIMLIAAGLIVAIYYYPNNIPPYTVDIDLGRFNSIYELQNYIHSNLIKRAAIDARGPFYGGVLLRETAAPMGEEGAFTGVGPEYSLTNVQVEGIDEADYVKTDGYYIYFKNGSKIMIAKAYPPEELNIVSVIQLENTSINGLYIYDGKLIILTQRGGFFVIMHAVDVVPEDRAVEPAVIGGPEIQTPVSNIYIYDVREPSNPVLIHNITLTGDLFDSRLFDNKLFIILNDFVYGVNETIRLPSYVIDGVNTTISVEEIYYLKNLYEYGYQYTMVFSIDLDTWTNSVTTILSGSTSTLYMSYNNIYIAQPIFIPETLSAEERRWLQRTAIIKIKIDGINTEPTALAVVDGVVNEQFQMDEFNNYLRISTYVWESIRKPGEFRVKTYTNIYVLDKDLKIVGSLTGLGETEQLYATRFMGNYAYLVTFRRIDPLFVINLTDPENPRVVGELKIPGFSDMLQPIGQGLIVGIGYINEDGVNKLKISLFNVSDPTNPIEISNLTIGNEWISSEATQNHKAILIPPIEGVFGIPISTYELKTTISNETNQTITITMPVPVYKYLVFNTSGGELSIIKEITIDIPVTTMYGKPMYMFWYEYVRGIYIEKNVYVVTPYNIIVEPLEP